MRRCRNFSLPVMVVLKCAVVSILKSTEGRQERQYGARHTHRRGTSQFQSKQREAKPRRAGKVDHQSWPQETRREGDRLMDRLTAIEARLAAIEAALPPAKKHPRRARKMMASRFRLAARRNSKHLPNEDEARALLKIVTARYPQLKFRNADEELESFCASFPFICSLTKTAAPISKYSISWWIDTAPTWCRSLMSPELLERCYQQSSRPLIANIRSTIEAHFGSIHIAVPAALLIRRRGAKYSTAAICSCRQKSMFPWITRSVCSACRRRGEIVLLAREV